MIKNKCSDCIDHVQQKIQSVVHSHLLDLQVGNLPSSDLIIGELQV